MNNWPVALFLRDIQNIRARTRANTERTYPRNEGYERGGACRSSSDEVLRRMMDYGLPRDGLFSAQFNL